MNQNNIYFLNKNKFLFFSLKTKWQQRLGIRWKLTPLLSTMTKSIHLTHCRKEVLTNLSFLWFSELIRLLGLLYCTNCPTTNEHRKGYIVPSRITFTPFWFLIISPFSVSRKEHDSDDDLLKRIDSAWNNYFTRKITKSFATLLKIIPVIENDFASLEIPLDVTDVFDFSFKV